MKDKLAYLSDLGQMQTPLESMKTASAAKEPQSRCGTMLIGLKDPVLRKWKGKRRMSLHLQVSIRAIHGREGRKKRRKWRTNVVGIQRNEESVLSLTWLPNVNYCSSFHLFLTHCSRHNCCIVCSYRF